MAEDIKPPNKLWPQVLAVMSCFFCQLTMGTAFGWVSPSLVKLQADNSPIPTSSGEGSTIVSITSVGGVIGPLLFAYKVDIIGRKWMAFFGCFFCLISWFIMIFSTEVWHLYLGRIVVGLGIGYTFGLIPLYFGEIAETHMRAKLSIIATILSAGGSLFCYGIGPSLDFQIFNTVCTVFPVLGFVFLIWMPESPYFLMRQGRKNEAEKVVMWLRGQDDVKHVQDEIDEIEKFVKSSPMRPLTETLKELKLKCNLKAGLIMTVMMLAQQFNGASALKTYFHLILIETESPLDTESTVVVVEVVGLCVLLLSFFFIEKAGRRPLFLISCAGVIVGSFISGGYFMLKSEGVIDNSAAWMVLLGLSFTQISNCFGIMPIPTVIGSEMSSASVRSWYGGYKAICMSVFNALNAKIFQIIRDESGTQYSFWMGTAIVCVCAVVIYNILPETKGKSLSEIQLILSGKESQHTDKKSKSKWSQSFFVRNIV